jgi:hypothetical protein
MAAILSILLFLVGIATAVVAIMVLIKLFQTEGPLKGIIGLICFLYTYIWGWMNANKLNIKNLMLIWTGLFVVLMILYVVVFATAFSGMQGAPPVTP